MMNRSILALVLTVSLLCPALVQAQLQSSGTQFWHQGSPGVPVGPEANAEFGDAVSSGDFNCDGFDDVAFGMPRDDLIGADDGGRVLVLYAESSGAGLGTSGPQVWSQAGTAVPGDPSAFDGFGRTLASGDFDNDGCDDLVIGVPGDDVDGVFNAGGVHVIYGSSAGLSITGIDYWHQGPDSAGANLEAGDLYGSALAVGDFNDDGRDDLAIGSPGEDIGTNDDAGSVQVLFGSAFGLLASGDVILRRGTNLFGTPVAGERLGSVLAAGNVAGIPGDELVIGIPEYDITIPAFLPAAGAIMLVSDIDGNVFNATYTQDSNDIPGVAEAGDELGSALALGDFDGNGFLEVAAAARGEDIEQPAPERETVGVVNIFDFTAGAHDLWSQDDLGPEQAEDFDQFGSALVAADFDGDGTDDLAIGTPGEDLGPIFNAGLVHILYGQQDTGLSDQGRQVWLQTLDASGAQDFFGTALAAGTINAGAGADLVIGAPGNTVGGLQATGSATLIYSIGVEMFSDGFESP